MKKGDKKFKKKKKISCNGIFDLSLDKSGSKFEYLFHNPLRKRRS